MEKKMSTNDVKSLLTHVIRTIDHWWVETTDLKQGFFTRSNINNSLVTYKDYVEWRCSETVACKDYMSIFISLDYADGTDYIRMSLRKMKNGVYTEYDPFCEIHNGKVDATISEDSGYYEWLSVFDDHCFNELIDNIAATVYRFTNPSHDEEEASVNMDDVSKTLSVYDIQDCMIKAMRIMLVDRDTVNELIRLSSKYVVDAHDLSPTQYENMLGYVIETTPNHVTTRIVYNNATTNITLCIFTCEPDTHTHEQLEFIIRYNSRDTGFEYEQGFIILYKTPEGHCFEYAPDGLNTEKIFKPFVNILRNTLNYELYQSRCQDTAITAPAGLTTKEVFVLDTSYFVIGDIYLLEIDSIYDWSKISTTPIKVPSQVYAICEDVCPTVIHFMLGHIEGRDGLLKMSVHADEIESGLITVKRALSNETLFSKEDKQNA